MHVMDSTEFWNIQAFDFIGFGLCVEILELRHIVRFGRRPYRAGRYRQVCFKATIYSEINWLTAK